MRTNSLHHNYLLFVTIFVVFYPTKGLLNLLYYFPQFESYPGIFNKFIFGLLIISLSIMLLHSKFDINKYLIHVICTMIAITLSIINGDIHLINKVLMLFIFPILLSVLDNVPEIYIERVIRSFFKFTLIYMATEFILLNIRFDVNNLITKENYETFYSILTPHGTTIDYRHPGSWWVFRSGGYLADAIAMPVLVVMSALYFYINYRLYKKYQFYTIIGIFLVISNPSTTGIVSYLFTIVLFEVHHFRLSRFITISSMIFIFILIHPTTEYIIIRLSENFHNEVYMSTYFDYDFIFQPKIYLYFIFGRWTWFDDSISSHLDIYLLPSSMGIIALYIMYKIFFRGFYFYRKNNNLFTIYSYILISTAVNLYHHGMTLSVNVIILVILISSRVNNSIKPKISFNLFYLIYQLNRIVTSKVNKKFKLFEIVRNL